MGAARIFYRPIVPHRIQAHHQQANKVPFLRAGLAGQAQAKQKEIFNDNNARKQT